MFRCCTWSTCPRLETEHERTAAGRIFPQIRRELGESSEEIILLARRIDRFNVQMIEHHPSVPENEDACQRLAPPYSLSCRNECERTKQIAVHCY
jgi:hypothetical protein